MAQADKDAHPRPVDPETGLPLPEPYPEYVACPHCGEPEVEIWCYQARARCHNCGGWIEHISRCSPTSPECQPFLEQEQRRIPPAD